MGTTPTLWVLFLLASSGHCLQFHSYYGDKMILQRGGEGSVGSKVWGYGEIGDDSHAMLECETEKGFVQNSVYTLQQVKNNIWEVTLEPRNAGDVCQLQIYSGEESLSLNDLLFGDVWICSGQSNMEQSMVNIINSDEEIANSANLSQIRFTVIQNTIAYGVDDDLDVVLDFPWTDPSWSEALEEMSAICFLYGRSVFQETGVPQGLVASDWGGTPIESWTTGAVLDSCNVPAGPEPCAICDAEECEGEMYCYSVLWNAMINPLKRNFVRGFLWYQGETNGGYGGYPGFNRDYYQCTFPALITSWREEFSAHSMTDKLAPFGFVQLAAWRPDSDEASFPVIRWHQTADQGYVPNKDMENVFMAVSLDTYDDKEGYPGNLHPRYKKVVAERLAVAGLNIAYGLDFPTSGPFPLSIESDGDAIIITYDKEPTYNANEMSGFYYCYCGSEMSCSQLEECDAGVELSYWKEVPKGLVTQLSSNQIMIDLNHDKSFYLSYLWRETPVLTYLGLPVYDTVEPYLPSPPWKYLVEINTEGY